MIHEVFADALSVLLARDPQVLSQQHRLAASLALESEDEISALHHLQRIEAWEAALSLALPMSEQGLKRQDQQLIRIALEGFPVQSLPIRQQALLARVLMANRQAAKAEHVLLLWDADKIKDGYALATLALIEGRNGSFTRQLALAERGLQSAKSDSDRWELGRIKANALLGLGQHQQAEEIASRVVMEASAAHDSGSLAAGYNVLQRVQRVLGQREASEETLRRALELYATLDQPLVTLGLRCDLADFYRLRGSIPEAFDILNTALEIAQDGASDLTAVIHEGLADLHLWRQDHASALNALEQGATLATNSGMRTLNLRIRLKRTEALIPLGRLEEATADLDELCGECQHFGGWLWHAWLFSAGLNAFARGEFEESIQRFENIGKPLADLTHEPRRLALIDAARHAQAQLEMNEVTPLLEALKLFGPQDVLQIDRHLTHEFLAWLSGRLDVGLLTGSDPSHQAPVLNAPYALQIQTFDEVKIRFGGRLIVLPFVKCTELLVWLSWHGQGSKDAIINALWDGSREPRHHEYFRVTVRRLRQVLIDHAQLEFNPLPYEHGLYRLHPLIAVTIDALDLLKSAQRGDWQSAWEAVPEGDLRFMSTFESEWLDDIRLSCQRLAFEAALHAADHWRMDQLPLAQQALERAVTIEPLSANAHESLIRLCAERHDFVSATAAYERYAQMLRREFGTQPPEAFTRWVSAWFSQKFPTP
ncbi:MAG: tetratricopeptide repeat protein [Pleurocapsa sp. SU_196_0]|nr:tetratricopeptide repeat protein [Pleurocapsa sp. SU_196_0]